MTYIAGLLICLAVMSMWHDLYPWLSDQARGFDCQLG